MLHSSSSDELTDLSTCTRESTRRCPLLPCAPRARSTSPPYFAPPFIFQLTGLCALHLLAGSGLQALCERNCNGRTAATCVNEEQTPETRTDWIGGRTASLRLNPAHGRASGREKRTHHHRRLCRASAHPLGAPCCCGRCHHSRRARGDTLLVRDAAAVAAGATRARQAKSWRRRAAQVMYSIIYTSWHSSWHEPFQRGTFVKFTKQ